MMEYFSPKKVFLGISLLVLAGSACQSNNPSNGILTGDQSPGTTPTPFPGATPVPTLAPEPTPAPLPTGTPVEPGNGSFYKKGGDQAVQQVVRDIVTSPTVDPEISNQLISCLNLQMTAVLGGPATYPGISYYGNTPTEGFICNERVRAQENLGVTSEAFSQFQDDLRATLKADGLSEKEILLSIESLQ